MIVKDVPVRFYLAPDGSWEVRVLLKDHGKQYYGLRANGKIYNHEPMPIKSPISMTWVRKHIDLRGSYLGVGVEKLTLGEEDKWLAIKSEYPERMLLDVPGNIDLLKWVCDMICRNFGYRGENKTWKGMVVDERVWAENKELTLGNYNLEKRRYLGWKIKWATF